MPSENNTPAIRFAGFTGEWEKRKFSDAFAFLQNNTLSRAELSDSGDGAKNIHYGDILVKLGECINVSIEPLPVITDKKTINKYRSSHLQNGDVVIADTAEDETVGKCSEIMGANGETIISGLHTIPCRPTESYAEGFLGHYMNSSAYHDQLIPLMQGIKVTSISKRSLQTTEVKHPKDSAEQSSLGSFFLNLNTLITLHRRKCELLETLKKSMLEKLFPKEGKLVPELRFAGFTGEWEWRNFGNIASRMCELSTERSLPRVEYEDIISERGVLNKDIKLKNCHKAGIRFDHQNVLYGKLRPYLHNWLLPDFTGIAVGDFWVLLPQGIDRSFLFALIQSSRFDNVANQSTGTKMPRADWKLVSKSKFLVPIASGEQHQIGRFIYLIEECITLHRRKLELQQNIKKACLEKMFV